MDRLNLVGPIVEKDQSENWKVLSPAKPTGVTFPVARHRSHKTGARTGSKLDDDDGDNEHIDDTDYNRITVLANPIKRKERKRLDFNNWRDLVPEVTHIVSQKAKKSEGQTKLSGVKLGIREETMNAQGDRNYIHAGLNIIDHEKAGKEQCHQSVFRQIKEDAMELNSEQVDAVAQEVLKDDRLVIENDTSNEFLGRVLQPSTFLDDIDAENHLRIQNMSLEEIAEAQAKLKQKMSPAIIEMLKKRGQSKLQKCGSIQASISTQTHILKDPCLPPPAASDSIPNNSSMVEKAPNKCSLDGRDNQVLESSGESEHVSPWNHWTYRVEKIRSLRFLLDGSVVESDSVHVPLTSEHNSFNVGNATERDFLRTEGDPSAIGYTIKEAVALIRSVIPGQRTLALQILSVVIDKALSKLVDSNVGDSMASSNCVDWQAVWAFALVPEPELVLSLRMALDDNHISVVLAGAKVIQCILGCDLNENFFSISEKLAVYEKGISTAPIFRSKQEIDFGFLHGGFWKPSAKRSNIFPFNNENLDENEQEHTIQDDNVVAGQDVAAGLIRMGILPRIRYLLEMEPILNLENCLITILIGLSRHSKTSANAVMKCPRLIQTIVDQFIRKETMEVDSSYVKSVVLLKVLAQSGKRNCEYFIENGIFKETMRHFYRYTSSIAQWTKSGRDYCKLTSALMVEQMRFWKVCICYGHCISLFGDFFPAMCLWLSPPNFSKLIESDVFVEYFSITSEAYATLGALAKSLSYLHAPEHGGNQTTESKDNRESWSWSYAVPIVYMALKWIDWKNDPYLSLIFSQQKVTTSNDTRGFIVRCLLWVISAVMHMFCNIIERIAPPEWPNHQCESDNLVPWLPEFIPIIGLVIVKNGWLKFSDANYLGREKFPIGGQSIVQDLCSWRYDIDFELSLASVCCLHGVLQLVILLDKYIQISKSENVILCNQIILREDEILQDGMITMSRNELKNVLIMFMNLVSLKWIFLHSIESFNRGGPSPGIGIGWGASGGGYWSKDVLLANMDARLVLCLLDIFPIMLKEPIMDNDNGFCLQQINSILEACLVAGPRDKTFIEKAFEILFHDTVLKCLDSCIHHFLSCNIQFESFKWEYKEDDFIRFSKVLSSHFGDVWLKSKKKSSGRSLKKSEKFHPDRLKCETLDTIDEEKDDYEEIGHDSTSLLVEWVQQRLPLPIHFFLSPISTIYYYNLVDNCPGTSSEDHTCSSIVGLDVAESGLFLLLGLEAMVSFAFSNISHSPVLSIPLVWKLHSLCMVLFAEMGILQNERSRGIYGTLQVLYGMHLDQFRQQMIKSLEGKDENLSSEISMSAEFLKFKSDIHESYPTFVETLIEKFSAISYGDEFYGRQVAFYLHRSVEAPVRLAAWNALSSAQVLELLPPIGKCVAEAEGYLEPVEDNEGILEAYVKSWISGCLDKSMARLSLSSTLVLHHLSCFIFETKAHGKLSLRKKLARSLMRDYCRKPQHKDMLLNLIRRKPSVPEDFDVGKRFKFLSEACEGHSSLLIEVERLKSLG